MNAFCLFFFFEKEKKNARPLENRLITSLETELIDFCSIFDFFVVRGRNPGADAHREKIQDRNDLQHDGSSMQCEAK